MRRNAIEQVGRVFFARSISEIEEARKDDHLRFAYYTTAATALKILGGSEIWMRNTLMMNDSSEIHHGIACLDTAFKSPKWAELVNALDRCFQGIAKTAQDTFMSISHGLWRDTFVTCLSEHREDDDDLRFGRLSMWRAYGGNAGVALIFKKDPLLGMRGDLPVYTSKVLYGDERTVLQEISDLADRIKANREAIKECGAVNAQFFLTQALRFAAICIKHRAFLEEREWRAITSPALDPHPRDPTEIVEIAGIPQAVIKLKLEKNEVLGVDLDLRNVLDSVLIGPCEQPVVICRALQRILFDKGIDQKSCPVHMTDIPFRQIQR